MRKIKSSESCPVWSTRLPGDALLSTRGPHKMSCIHLPPEDPRESTNPRLDTLREADVARRPSRTGKFGTGVSKELKGSAYRCKQLALQRAEFHLCRLCLRQMCLSFLNLDSWANLKQAVSLPAKQISVPRLGPRPSPQQLLPTFATAIQPTFPRHLPLNLRPCFLFHCERPHPQPAQPTS